jgi:hypothetical protein
MKRVSAFRVSIRDRVKVASTPAVAVPDIPRTDVAMLSRPGERLRRVERAAGLTPGTDQELVGACVQLGDVAPQSGRVRPQPVEIFGITAKPVMLRFEIVELGSQASKRRS